MEDLPLTKQKNTDENIELVKTKKKKTLNEAQLNNLVKGRAKLKEIFDLKKSIDAVKKLEKPKKKIIEYESEDESIEKIIKTKQKQKKKPIITEESDSEEEPKIIIKKIKKKKPTIIEVEESESESEEEIEEKIKHTPIVKRHFKSQENTRKTRPPYNGNNFEGFI